VEPNEPNEPKTKSKRKRRTVSRVDGSACATRALELAAKEAVRWDVLLRIVSAFRQMPAEGERVILSGMLHEAGRSDRLGCAPQERGVGAVNRRQGRDGLDEPGPASAHLSHGAAARRGWARAVLVS
jgi:hypothetical protein